MGFRALAWRFFLHDDHWAKKVSTLENTLMLSNVCSFIVTVEESNTCINKSGLFNGCCSGYKAGTMLGISYSRAALISGYAPYY